MTKYKRRTYRKKINRSNRKKSNRKIKRTKKNKKSKVSGGNNKNISFVSITAEWCGHCQVLKPIIEDLKSKLKNIAFISIDSETIDEQIKDIKKSHNVDINKPNGFPSLGKIVSGSYIEYPSDKPRDIGSLIQFLSH